MADVSKYRAARTSMNRRRGVTMIVALVLALALVMAGCGSSNSSSSSSAASGGSGASSTSTTTHVGLAKTKFVLHSGLAFGAFHHFIYKPVRAGDLQHPLSHKLTLIRAGLAAAFVYHELKLALHDAQSSPTLSKLVSPLTALGDKLHGLGSQLKSGHANPADITQANDQIGSISKQSSDAGQPITEQVPANF